MIFLAIIIVLALIQLWSSGGRLQQDHWFCQWLGLCLKWLPLSSLRLLVVVGAPVFLVLLLDEVFRATLFGLPALGFYVVVLLYSLGRGDFNQAIKDYLQSWTKGDFEEAYKMAMPIGDFKQTDSIRDHVSLHEHVRRAILFDGFERWFAVVFWFLVLGPAGAIGYRLSYLCGRYDQLPVQERQLALRFLHYLDWLPVRLLGFSFALTGNFVQCFQRCYRLLWDNMPSSEFLDDCAMASLEGGLAHRGFPVEQQYALDHGAEEITEVQSLLSRSVVCWLILIALLQII